MATSNQINDNIIKHERIAKQYDARHIEINNKVEQDRLHGVISWSVSQCAAQNQIEALDFGCGTGNLTRHLLECGCIVTAADVTPTFVSMASALDSNRTKPHVLNGRDLNEFRDGQFDVTATYSVLHHIPDYLLAVRELVRVTKPGGIIVIDHEASSSYWSANSIMEELETLTRLKRPWTWYLRQLLSLSWWLRRFRKTLNPRYSVEGDIHVWPDDHIEWDRIRNLFVELGVENIRDEDYLLFQPHYSIDVYNQFRDKCFDMHILVGRKR